MEVLPWPSPPFGDFGDLTGPHALQGQYRQLADPAPSAFGEQCLPTVTAMQGRFVVPDDAGGAPCKDAYPFDATRYAAFLCALALRRGARRTEGRNVDVARLPSHPACLERVLQGARA